LCRCEQQWQGANFGSPFFALSVLEGLHQMDYYQGVVSEYLRANRATFINTEFCIQIGTDPKVFGKGEHWFCDAIALNFQDKTVYLCEITFAKNAPKLLARLQAWSDHWPEVQAAVRRDAKLGKHLDDWVFKPWLFVPQEGSAALEKRLTEMKGIGNLHFDWRLTPLEETQPWRYRSWDRNDDSAHSEVESTHGSAG
jgi:hypothetical protein